MPFKHWQALHNLVRAAFCDSRHVFFNLTHLTTNVMFSGQRFAILAMFSSFSAILSLLNCAGFTFQSVLKQVSLKQQCKTISEDHSVFLFFWPHLSLWLTQLWPAIILEAKKRIHMKRGVSNPPFLISAQILSLWYDNCDYSVCCCKMSNQNIINRISGKKGFSIFFCSNDNILT